MTRLQRTSSRSEKTPESRKQSDTRVPQLPVPYLCTHGKADFFVVTCKLINPHVNAALRLQYHFACWHVTCLRLADETQSSPST